ncbi:transposase family protein [Solihabitans fulvus]|uniref:transposase family protein n=1 Tax=Solihabitans fulvus TaxID=1892852 RepID=UPI001CB75EAA|nr:transposase family protein [Solihabitans fulvus]
MPDPRHRRGIGHLIGTLLTLAALAVTTGARSLAAIAEWASDLPHHVLAELGARRDPVTGRHQPTPRTRTRARRAGRDRGGGQDPRSTVPRPAAPASTCWPP